MSGAPWLRDLRHNAAEIFAELGAPTNKHEAWRHANVTPLADLPLPVAPRPKDLHLTHVAVPRLGHRVLLADGHYFAEPFFHLPEGVTVMSLAAASAQDHPVVRAVLGTVAKPEERSLTALNTAAHQDGVLIDLADGAALDRPLHLVHVSRGHDTPIAHHPRVVARLGRGARLALLESFHGTDRDVLNNAVTEIAVSRDAHLDHTRLITAGGSTVAATYATVGDHAHYRLHAATIGSTLAREEFDISLAGRGARATLGGLLLGRGDTVVDHHVELEHVAAETKSDQQFRSILDDGATGNFAGKVIVQPSASHTAAHQSSRALLLSERARANAKPQLEIYTDDVRCTHGATSGQLDDSALFYLRARGIEEAEARTMLTTAFAGEWLERIEHPELRDCLTHAVHAWLTGAAS